MVQTYLPDLFFGKTSPEELQFMMTIFEKFVCILNHNSMVVSCRDLGLGPKQSQSITLFSSALKEHVF